MVALPEVDPRSVEMDPDALARVVAIFEAQHAEGLHPGAQLCVFRHGRCVLDRHIGVARRETGEPVTAETLFLVFSASKPFGAMCIHKLAEAGELSLDDPVARYWPEFAANGKQAATIAHVLTHRVGIPLGPRWFTPDLWGDYAAGARAMEERVPRWPVGEEVGYHPLNWGWMVRELVRRVSGRKIGQYLREEFLQPLGIREAFLGLPAEYDQRVAHHHALMPEAGADSAEAVVPGIELWNRPEVYRCEAPAANLIATARALARFYVMLLNGGELEGVRVLQPETIRRATSEAVFANPDKTLGVPVRWAYGFHLGGGAGNPFGSLSSPSTFGHSGHGSTVAWGDPQRGAAYAYLTNGVRDRASNTHRQVALADAVLSACR